MRFYEDCSLCSFFFNFKNKMPFATEYEHFLGVPIMPFTLQTNVAVYVCMMHGVQNVLIIQNLLSYNTFRSPCESWLLVFMLPAKTTSNARLL
jgi:hypothetical protein